jgi:hypothetical protein
MIASRTRVGLLLLAGLMLLAFGPAPGVGEDQPKKDDPAAADKEKIDTKATPQATAAKIKFKKDFGLSYPTLGTLASRIDAARRAHDPVALANAASELNVAEKVSGKKSSLLAKELMKESAQLAAQRRQVTELRAVTTTAESIADTDDTIKSLKQILAEEKAQEAADSEAIRMNQEPTWTPRKVIVNNYTTQYIDVWVNGSYKVQVAPGLTQSIIIEHRWNPTVLTGYGDDDEQQFGPVNIWGRFKMYTWNIN